MTTSDGTFEPNDTAAFGRFVSRMSLLAPDDLVPSAWLGHGPFLFWLVERLAPRTFVELGTHRGFSYFVACQAVKKLGLDTSCYAVDTWAGDEHAGFYDSSVYDSVALANRKYANFSTLVKSTFDGALEYFADGSVDFLHIDGRHFYDDAKKDFESWRPKLSPDAIVMFHDTNVRERGFGVWRLFAELKDETPTFEFKHGNGLGIVAVGQPPNRLRDLFHMTPRDAEDVRYIYGQLGGALEERWQTYENERTARLEREKAFEDERDALQSRLDDAEYHLGRLNAYGWTRLGLTFDAAVKKVSKMLPGSQPEAPKEPPARTRDDRG